jgi:hypothetical protein
MIMEILVRAIQSRRINQKLVKSIKPLLRTSNDGEIPYFDALQFFRKAKRIVALPEFNVAFNKFKAELGKTSIIVSKYVLDHRKLCGFSLYLPLNREEFDRLKGNQCNYFERIVNNRLTDFAIETQFDEFLKALYENLPAVPRQTIPALPLAISVSEGVMKEADEEVGGVPKGY